MTAIYAPEPLAVLPTPSGDMIVMGQKFPQTFLWRGSYNLQDTLWQQALTPEGGFFSYKIIYPNRLMYNTPDQGAVLGGVDSAGIFLLKINAAGQYQTTGTEPSDPEPPMGSLRVAPNPARDHAFVFFPTPDYDQLIVTDRGGQKVRVFELPPGRTEFVLDCRQMPPGVYGLTAGRPDGAMVFGKLSVQ